MKDPYITGNTLTPGEMADDDPHNDDGEVYCEECRENVKPFDQKEVCPQCGNEVME